MAKIHSKRGFEAKKLHEKIKKKLDYLDSQKPRVRNSLGLGAGVSAAHDPILGIPLAIPGLLGMLRDAGTRSAIKQRLLKKPRAARLMAKKFEGTKHELFFMKIAEKAEKSKQKKKQASQKQGRTA